MNLCKYKDILGKPKEGMHQYRIFNIAVFDLILTIILAYLIGLYTGQSFLVTFIVLMIVGLIVHRIFCVETTLTTLVFPMKSE